MYVVNAQLNELPVMFSVCVNEGQDNFPMMYVGLTKDRTKLDFLQFLHISLVLLLNFLNH